VVAASEILARIEREDRVSIDKLIGEGSSFEGRADFEEAQFR